MQGLSGLGKSLCHPQLLDLEQLLGLDHQYSDSGVMLQEPEPQHSTELLRPDMAMASTVELYPSPCPSVMNIVSYREHWLVRAIASMHACAMHVVPN